MEKITYTFPSGLTATGTIDELEKIATSLGGSIDYKKIGKFIRGYFPSESKGVIKISDMNDYHIRRALLKTAKEYFDSMYDSKDTNKEFLSKFLNLAEDTMITDLFTELNKR